MTETESTHPHPSNPVATTTDTGIKSSTNPRTSSLYIGNGDDAKFLAIMHNTLYFDKHVHDTLNLLVSKESQAKEENKISKTMPSKQPAIYTLQIKNA